MAEKRWFPLESNPEVMNSFIDKLGIDTSNYSFCDILSTEDWALDMIQDPVLAVLFLYPLKESQPGYNIGSEPISTATGAGEIYFTKQIVSNACGTVAILHAIANNRSLLAIKEGSYIEKFVNDTIDMTPEMRGDYIGASEEIEVVHVESAEAGVSDQIAIDEVDNHFVCFVQHNNRIFELDGRQSSPIDLGSVTEGSFLRSAVACIRSKYMDLDPEETRFTMVALAKTNNDDDDDM